MTEKADEPKNAPEFPIGRFLKAKSLGGNRVICVVRLEMSFLRALANAIEYGNLTYV